MASNVGNDGNIQTNVNLHANFEEVACVTRDDLIEEIRDLNLRRMQLASVYDEVPNSVGAYAFGGDPEEDRLENERNQRIFNEDQAHQVPIPKNMSPEELENRPEPYADHSIEDLQNEIDDLKRLFGTDENPVTPEPHAPICANPMS